MSLSTFITRASGSARPIRSLVKPQEARRQSHQQSRLRPNRVRRIAPHTAMPTAPPRLRIMLNRPLAYLRRSGARLPRPKVTAGATVKTCGNPRRICGSRSWDHAAAVDDRSRAVARSACAVGRQQLTPQASSSSSLPGVGLHYKPETQAIAGRRPAASVSNLCYGGLPDIGRPNSGGGWIKSPTRWLISGSGYDSDAHATRRLAEEYFDA